MNTESHIRKAADAEKEMISACIQKDRRAQKELYEKYFAKLFPVAMRYMKNREEAQEATQIAFIKIFNSLGKYDNTGSFAGWMSRIVVNSCLDQLRKRKRNFTDGDLELAPEVSIDPDAIARFSEQELLDMIQRLDDKQRMVFSLVEIEGFKHKEVAEILQITEGTSRWYLNQAKTNLKEMIIKSNIHERGE